MSKSRTRSHRSASAITTLMLICAALSFYPQVVEGQVSSTCFLRARDSNYPALPPSAFTSNLATLEPVVSRVLAPSLSTHPSREGALTRQHVIDSLWRADSLTVKWTIALVVARESQYGSGIALLGAATYRRLTTDPEPMLRMMLDYAPSVGRQAIGLTALRALPKGEAAELVWRMACPVLELDSVIAAKAARGPGGSVPRDWAHIVRPFRQYAAEIARLLPHGRPN